jgi:hypothetical protein
MDDDDDDDDDDDGVVRAAEEEAAAAAADGGGGFTARLMGAANAATKAPLPKNTARHPLKPSRRAAALFAAMPPTFNKERKRGGMEGM